MLKKTGKIFEIILSIMIVIVIITTVYSLVQIKILKHDYIDMFGYTILNVVTGSMSGSIEVGDVVIVKILNAQDELRSDDIVVYKKDNSLITHRIIAINEDTVITKGDANNTEDEPIKKEDIIGKVVKTIPNVGIWKKVFSEPEVYMSILTTIILSGITVSYFKYDKTKERENGKET